MCVCVCVYVFNGLLLGSTLSARALWNECHICQSVPRWDTPINVGVHVLWTSRVAACIRRVAYVCLKCASLSLHSLSNRPTVCLSYHIQLCENVCFMFTVWLIFWIWWSLRSAICIYSCNNNNKSSQSNLGRAASPPLAQRMDDSCAACASFAMATVDEYTQLQVCHIHTTVPHSSSV